MEGSTLAVSPRAHVYVADATLDTLDATVEEVMPAARRALEDDHWRMVRDSGGARMVTEWREFHHPLARLLMGGLRARCVVDVRPIGGRRTAVRFCAGLATASDPQGNPAFAVAQGVYRSSVQSFYRDLRAAIAEDRKAAASAGGSVASAP